MCVCVSVCVCVCVCVEVVMTLGCAFVLMLADGAKPCTCANNLQDSRDGEDKQTHRGAASVCVCVCFSSFLKLRAFRCNCYLEKKRGGAKKCTQQQMMKEGRWRK